MKPMVFTFGVMLASCAKDHQATGIPSIDQYSLLVDGNYWIYDQYALDSSGNDTGPPVNRDSVWVDGDTLINGIVWKRIRSSWGGDFPPIIHYRDSAEFLLVRGHGAAMASSLTDKYLWTEVFTGIVSVDYKLFVTPQTIVVDAGSFSCQEVKGLMSSLGGPVPPEHRFPRAYWRAGIGLVRQRYFWYVAGTGSEVRLVRYHVQ